MTSSSKAKQQTKMNRDGRPVLASLYDLAEYDSDEESQRHPAVPPNNLASAAMFVTELFAHYQIPTAIMGGFALRLLGSNRETRDVDIVFQAPRNFLDMWDIIDQERRLIIPKQRTVAGVAKIFVRTGGEWDNCNLKIPIEVDLIQHGSLGSPPDVIAHRTPYSFSNGRTIYIVEIYHLLRGKLNTYANRGARKDLRDIHFLTSENEDRIPEFRKHLDPENIRKYVQALNIPQRSEHAALYGIRL